MRDQFAPEELPGHCLLRDRRARQIRIEALEQPRAPGRARLARPETPDLAFAEEVVAGERFVGAFARQHDLDALVAHEPREQEERRRRGPQDRTLRVAHDCRECLRDVAARHEDLVMLAFGECGSEALIGRLVVFRIFEAQGKRLQPPRDGAARERGDERAVQSPGQIAADGHVCTHAQRRCALERVAHFHDRIVERAAELLLPGRRVARSPIDPLAWGAVLVDAHGRAPVPSPRRRRFAAVRRSRT